MVKTEVLLDKEVIWAGDAEDIHDALDSAGVEVLAGTEEKWYWELNSRNKK